MSSPPENTSYQREFAIPLVLDVEKLQWDIVEDMNVLPKKRVSDRNRLRLIFLNDARR